MREPSQWNTIIAIGHAVLLFTAIFTGMFTAFALAVWIPIAVGRKTISLAKQAFTESEDVSSDSQVAYEADYKLSPVYALIEKIARRTPQAWPTNRF